MYHWNILRAHVVLDLTAYWDRILLRFWVSWFLVNWRPSQQTEQTQTMVFIVMLYYLESGRINFAFNPSISSAWLYILHYNFFWSTPNYSTRENRQINIAYTELFFFLYFTLFPLLTTKHYIYLHNLQQLHKSITLLS